MGSRANHMAARTSLCKASGQDGYGTARIGNGVFLSLVKLPRGFSQISTNPQSAGQSCQSAGILLV